MAALLRKSDVTSSGAVLRVLAWLVISLGGARSQELVQPPSIEDSKTRVGSLPLDVDKRSRLQSAIQEHRYSEAESLLAAEAERNPQSQPLLLLLADLLFLDGKQVNTITVLKKAELLGQLDERSRFLLALSYVSLGQKNLAIPQFRGLAESNPAKAIYPYWLSRLMYRKMDLEKALLYAQQAVRLDPAFAKAYDQLGLCYAGLNQNEPAIQAYKDAIRLGNEQSLHSPWPSMNLGTLYLRMDRLEEAESTLRLSIAVEPRFPVAHFRLGQVLEKTGDLTGASRELAEAAKLDPTYPEPHYVLARIARLQRDEKSAQEQLRIFRDLRAADKEKGITRPD